ncbi:MAG: hypothetical protein KDD48_04370 [Bdellovibrionales bacterium]|nr:hypothetical protein [Bdellovibrionales bacterium]
MSQTIENKVISRIYGKGRGWSFTPSHFSDLGNNTIIRKSLSNLEKKGKIRRLAFGIYDYPSIHKDLGTIAPDLDKVARAIAERDQIRIQPGGAYAANLLGLSEQVPGKVIYLTDGKSSKITIGKRQIIFRKTTAKNMKTAGSISGLVIQALRYLGKDHMTPTVIKTLTRKLTQKDIKRLKLDAHLAPAWITQIIREDVLS